MLVLVSKSPDSLVKHYQPNLGLLVTPDNGIRPGYGWPWACDNSAFSEFNEEAYLRMLDRIPMLEGSPLFITAPDVVGDAEATLDLFDEWVEVVAEVGPVALVAQDGLEPDHVRWLEVDAIFIGGTTEWKMSAAAHRIVHRAHDEGKWVHMGRVNSYRRIKLAKAWGCHSIDGTKVVRWTDTHLPDALERASAHPQGVFDA